MERLHKAIAKAGIASRRKSEELILQGRVKVNGRLVQGLGVKVHPTEDKIEVDGQLVQMAEPKVYLLLYKPVGYVTTTRDQFNRPKVTDLVKDVGVRVYPVGRLDYHTEGLLLLTNDGELTNCLSHPRFKVEKTYRALVKGVPAEESLAKLRRGVMLEDGPTAPARARLIRSSARDAIVELTIREGRNRQVRRMFAKVGHPVLHLTRTGVASLNLDGLHPGAYRELTREEVQRLKKLAGCPSAIDY